MPKITHDKERPKRKPKDDSPFFVSEKEKPEPGKAQVQQTTLDKVR
jgi:hypothetical protein